MYDRETFITKEEELEYRIKRLEHIIVKCDSSADVLEKIAKSIMEFEKEHCGSDTGFHMAAGVALSLISSAILKEVIELRRNK